MADTTIEYIRDPALDNEEMKKIFVAGIPGDTTDDDLKTLFEETADGAVEECSIVRKEGKKSHFGFVTFETSELVDEALLKKASLKIGEKELLVNRAVPKNSTWAGAHEKTKKLFIANLGKTVKEEEIKEYFEKRHPAKYGTIEKIQLIKNKAPDGSKTEENKGFGFIFVTSEDMADKMSIQHSTFQFAGRKIELKKSVPTVAPDGGKGGGRGATGGGARGYGNMGGANQGGGRGGGYGQGGYGGGQGFADPYGQGGYGGDYTQGYGPGGYGQGGGFEGGYGGGYGNGFGYGGDPYAAAAAAYGGGYDQYSNGGYGYNNGYGAQQQQAQAQQRGRGRGRGGRGGGATRFAPY